MVFQMDAILLLNHSNMELNDLEWHLKFKPLDIQPIFDHLKSEHVPYLGP